MKKKRIVVYILLSLLSMLLCINVYSADEGFLIQLQFSLKAFGWSEEEITPLMHAARQMNWDSIENDNCDIVAYSLHYCKSRGQETEPGEKAVIAYHLAVASSEMRAMGFEEDEIARVTMNSTREIIASLHQYRNQGSDGEVGEMIRQRIREQVCNECVKEEQSKLMKRIRERTMLGKQNKKGNPDPDHEFGHGPPH